MVSGFIFILTVIFFIVVLVLLSNLKNHVTILQLQINELKKQLHQQPLPQQSQTESVIEENLAPLAASIEMAQETETPFVAKILPEPVINAQLSPEPTTISPSPIVTTNPLASNPPNVTKQPDEDSLGYRFIQWLIKGNPVAKVAIIILFFGLSYLLKYSIDHGLLSPEIRILGSLTLGLALLILGWKLRKKKELYALILQGGAIGVLYLTLFAAFKLYALVPLILTFVLLVIVCATSVMFAVLQRAISLAIIACVGGYLAPILLSSGGGNHIALFSYYLLISTAILVISFWQSWRVLNLIGFVFTFVVAMLWGYRSFRPEFYLECQIFILANMLIYGVLAVLLSVRNSQKESYQNLFDLILLFSVPLTAFSLQYSITQQWQYAAAFSALGFGLFYLVGSFIVLRIWQGRAKQLALYGLALGLGFSTLAVPLALTLNWTALVWLIEGSAISYVALAQRQHRFALIGSLIVLLGAIWSIITLVGYIDDTGFITLYGIMSALLLFNACLWHHYRQLSEITQLIKQLFIIAAILGWTVWIIGSVNRLYDNSLYTVQPIIACYVIAVWIWFAVGRKINWSILTYAVIALWPVLILALISNIFLDHHTYYGGLWGLSWLAAFISGYSYLYFNQKQLQLSQPLLPILHMSLLWIIFSWLFYELNWLLSFLPWGFAVIDWSILTLAAGLIILVFFVLQKYRAFPLAHLTNLYWQIGLLPLGLYLLFKLFSGLSHSGQIIYWTYIPFINPLEESAAFALIMLAIWIFNSIKSTDYKKGSQSLATYALVLIIMMTFLWGNSIILRSLSQWFDISWSFYALWHNHIVQIVLSLVWTLTAVILVMIANRYVMRSAWFAGAAIQAIVVLKLVFVDSVELDGLMRAFVFIGVALLMLVIGYLAPLPPKNEQVITTETENNPADI